jgi:sulfonate transport system substrate-binding protein
MEILMPRRSAAIGLGLLGASLAQRGYAQAAATEFHVGYQKAGLLGVARQQGVFERRLKPLGVESVKWSEFALGPPMMDAISKGSIDFGWVGDAPAIIAQSAGARFVYVAYMPASEHGLLVREGSALHSLADIKGKKIAVARNTSGQGILLRMLAKAGFAYGDIVPVYLSPADASAALSRGDVDAWVIHDPFFAEAEHHLKAHAIATTKDIVNGGSVYVANPDFAAKYPKVLATVIDEVTKLTAWAARDRDKFAEATSTATGIDLDAARSAISRSDLIAGLVTPAIAGELQRTADAFLKADVISRQVVIHNAVWLPPAG